MTQQLFWCGQPVDFQPGETIAAALGRALIVDLGPTKGVAGRYFCGIGVCQGCLVALDNGLAVEACLTPARAGMKLSSCATLNEGGAANG